MLKHIIMLLLTVSCSNLKQSHDKTKALSAEQITDLAEKIKIEAESISGSIKEVMGGNFIKPEIEIITKTEAPTLMHQLQFTGIFLNQSKLSKDDPIHAVGFLGKDGKVYLINEQLEDVDTAKHIPSTIAHEMLHSWQNQNSNFGVSMSNLNVDSQMVLNVVLEGHAQHYARKVMEHLEQPFTLDMSNTKDITVHIRYKWGEEIIAKIAEQNNDDAKNIISKLSQFSNILDLYRYAYKIEPPQQIVNLPDGIEWTNEIMPIYILLSTSANGTDDTNSFHNLMTSTNYIYCYQNQTFADQGLNMWNNIWSNVWGELKTKLLATDSNYQIDKAWEVLESLGLNKEKELPDLPNKIQTTNEMSKIIQIFDFLKIEYRVKLLEEISSLEPMIVNCMKSSFKDQAINDNISQVFGAPLDQAEKSTATIEGEEVDVYTFTKSDERPHLKNNKIYKWETDNFRFTIIESSDPTVNATICTCETLSGPNKGEFKTITTTSMGLEATLQITKDL